MIQNLSRGGQFRLDSLLSLVPPKAEAAMAAVPDRVGDEREPRWTKQKESRKSIATRWKENAIRQTNAIQGRPRGRFGGSDYEDVDTKKWGNAIRKSGTKNRAQKRREESRERERGRGRERKRDGEQQGTLPWQGAWPIGARWAPQVGGDSSAPTGDVITRGRVRRCSLVPPGLIPPPTVCGSGRISSLHIGDTRMIPPRAPMSLGNRVRSPTRSRILGVEFLPWIFSLILRRLIVGELRIGRVPFDAS